MEQALHVVRAVDRDTRSTHLAFRHRVIGVVTHLRG